MLKKHPIFLLPILLASFTLLASAQQAPAPSGSPNHGDQAAAKKRQSKVWTNDDISSVRTPADVYQDRRSAAETETHSASAVAANSSAPAKPAVAKGGPSLLTNPKSVEDADRMIAWTDNDLAAQTEYVEKVRQQLEDAPAAEKPRFQKLLADRIRVVDEIKKEHATLVQQKSDLQKSASSKSPAAQP